VCGRIEAVKRRNDKNENLELTGGYFEESSKKK
jgi:hypothetical protein